MKCKKALTIPHMKYRWFKLMSTNSKSVYFKLHYFITKCIFSQLLKRY